VTQSINVVLRGGVMSLCLFSAAEAAPLDDGLVAVKRHDYATAMLILRPLADRGDAVAQLNVGEMYAFGQGVTQDKPRGIEWYRKAAEQGNAEAEARLGSRYTAGNGVALDYATALHWLKKAAGQRDALGETMLGEMYVYGRGVPKDPAVGVVWLKRGATQGDLNAQASLGLIYAGGHGVPPDYVQAYMWCEVAMTRLPYARLFPHLSQADVIAESGGRVVVRAEGC
jgi:TPR repeat protein